VLKGSATVMLAGLSQTYDGTGKAVSVTTAPPGLPVNVTYNGSPNAPTNPGSYTVVATVNDPNYQGSATNTFVISVPLVNPGWDSTGRFQFSFTTAAGMDYAIQVSTDLKNWTSTLAFKGLGGPVTILDTNAVSSTHRFYRLQIEP
jgi:MBG domain